MKVAILDALPKRYWQDDNGYTDGEKLRDLLSPALPEASFDIFYVTEGQWPADLSVYRGLIASGSAASVHDAEPWISKLRQLLHQAIERQLKIIGICFSHQLIANMYGGEVNKNEDGWMIGNFRLTINEQFAWMNPQVDHTWIHHFNEERVSRLPAAAVPFADSELYPNFAFTIGDNILCVQGHPEQSTLSIGNWLKSMEGQMPDEEYREAQKHTTLGSPDSDLWASWFAEFLRA